VELGYLNARVTATGSRRFTDGQFGLRLASEAGRPPTEEHVTFRMGDRERTAIEVRSK
jgi:hypothetical protein